MADGGAEEHTNRDICESRVNGGRDDTQVVPTAIRPPKITTKMTASTPEAVCFQRTRSEKTMTIPSTHSPLAYAVGSFFTTFVAGECSYQH